MYLCAMNFSTNWTKILLLISNTGLYHILYMELLESFIKYVYIIFDYDIK